MSELALLSLEVENFKCFTATTRLKLASRPYGLHFLRGQNLTNNRLGSNGAGKSSLWDAFCWCLQGKTVGGLRTTDIKSWRAKGAARVKLTFSDGTRNRVVQRTAKPSRLTLDGETVGQEQIDKFLGLNFALLTQTVLLGQGQPLFFDLPPRDKMQLFSEVLGLDKWDKRSSAASRKANDLGSQLDRLDGELGALERSYEHASEAVETAEAARDTWSKERAVKAREVERTLKKEKKRRKQVEDLYAETNTKADMAGVERKSTDTVVNNLRTEREELALSLNSLKGENTHLRAQLTHIEEQRDELRATKRCPTCGHTVTKAQLDAQIQKLRNEAAPVQSQLEEGEAQHKKLSGGVADVTERLKGVVTHLNQTTEAEELLLLKGNQLRTELGELRAKTNALTDELNRLEEEDNPHTASVKQARNHALDLKKEHSAAVDEFDALEKEAEDVKFWVKGFREVQLMIVDEVLTDLEETTASLLEEMGLGEWAVRYTVERETKKGTVQRGLNVEVTSPDSEGPVRWEAWSGGEGQRLRIAGALALSEVLLSHAGVDLDVLILDEPTRHLSQEGVRDLCEVLAEYAESAQLHLWYVDHMAVDSAHFTTVTTVVNETDGSRIEE